MNPALVKTLLSELRKMTIVDPHTHVRAPQPVARHLGDLLGYHYYTELSNSARGKPLPLPDDPDERCAYVWPHLAQLRGTVQFDWMMGISEIFFDIPREDWFRQSRQEITRRAMAVISASDYESRIWDRSNIRKIYLTNLFDEDLSTLKDPRLIPALRTDDLVTTTDSTQALARLDKLFGVSSGRDLASWRLAVTRVFDRFRAWKMGYAACGLPPSFDCVEVPEKTAEDLLHRLAAGAKLDAQARQTWTAFALEEMAVQARRVNTPLCLMVGADRNVYAHGIPSGCDVVPSENHLRGYYRLLNKYPDVRFPFMVASDATGMELTISGWIRHNVYPWGHWWYLNNPTDIRRELRRRMDVLPCNKHIGFHSDGYSLEFTLPKFNTFRLQLALVLAERIEEGEIGGSTVLEGLDVPKALEFAEQILVKNCESLLG